MKQFVIKSSVDPVSPFIVTVPRLVKLLRHWPDKRAITVIGLADSGAGPCDEHAEMWEREDLESNDLGDSDDEDDHRMGLNYERAFDDDSDDDSSHSSRMKVGKKRTGIKALCLSNPNVEDEDFDLVLRHVNCSLLIRSDVSRERS